MIFCKFRNKPREKNIAHLRDLNQIEKVSRGS